MYHFGLIGYPIRHSLSPWIHGRFLAKAELQGSYELFEIDPALSFESEIKKLRDLNLDGFNVTVPFKETILPYLDEIDQEAEAIGAVNTVVNKRGKWIGYNTDGKGYIRSLVNKYPFIFDEKSKAILLIGAGGAARGIYYALTSLGCKHIDIANRTAESALSIASLASDSTRTNILSINEAEVELSNYDLIIQTTSVGMKPYPERTIMQLDHLKKTSIVSDIVYQPIETKILREAQNRDAFIHFGHTMLLYQAQYAFEIWTNKRVLVNDMDEELKQLLKG